MTETKHPLKKKARKAGLLYLLMAITGAFSMMYVGTNVLVPGEVAATVENIRSSPLLFRAGIVSNLVSQVTFIFLALALYQLFKEVSKSQAMLLVALVVAAVPVGFLAMLNQLAITVLLSGADYLTVFTPDQINGLIMVFLDLYNHGIYIAEIFWGLWLLPFGALCYKSGFIPKIFGVLVIIGGISYLILSFNVLLFPAYSKTLSLILMVPLSVGEFAIILWLLIKGAKVSPIKANESD